MFYSRQPLYSLMRSLCLARLLVLLAAFSFLLAPPRHATAQTVTDIDGNVYNTVVIGGYEWMAENLRTGKYANGTTIIRRAVNSWQLTDPDGGWDWYGGNSSNQALHGRLYEGNAVSVGTPPLCPTGWQVADNTAWQALADALGGASVAGAALKSTQGWSSGAGANASGFAATAGGRRRSSGYLRWSDSGLGTHAYFWSSSNRNTWILQSDSDALTHVTSSEWVDTGMSVRCVRVAVKPTINAAASVAASASSASIQAEVSDQGTSPVTARGVVWGVSSGPTLESNLGSTSDEGEAATFTSNLSGLSPGTRYIARAYATSFAGTTYGPDIVFETPAALTGVSGFRLLSAPRSGTVLSEFLAPLWTQGMVGADVTTGAPNVWTFDDAVEGDWTAVSDLTSQSIAAGQGFLVYVFQDTDYTGGNGTLPVDLSVTGTGEPIDADVQITGIADGQWHLAGNPYALTLDWDSMEKTNVGGSVYVYDHASTWRTWNGSVGELTGGRIAPHQGFFVYASGGTGSLTLSRGHAADAIGTFYKASGPPGSLSLALSVIVSYPGVDGAQAVTSLSDEAFLSFNAEGRPGPDRYDALKLMPFSVDERPLLLFEGSEDAAYGQGAQVAELSNPAPTWSIANLPWSGEGLDGQELTLPLQALHLGVDAEKGNVPFESAATLSWDASSLPDHVSVALRDLRTGSLTALEGQGEIAITTPEGPAIERVAGEGAPSYRARGDAAFELVVRYQETAVSTQDGDGSGPLGEFPARLSLEPNYPNPFNPSTQIRFGLPETTSGVTLTVHDLLGRRVSTLLEAQALPAGWHEITFDASALTSGTYVYTLRTPAGTLTRSLTLVR